MSCRSQRERRRWATPPVPPALFLLAALSCFGQSPPSDPLQDKLKGLTLEQLGNIEVTSVSKSPVSVTRTPAAVFVITQQDIRRSGATTLPDALRLAPGVEVARIDAVKWAIGIRGFEGRLSRYVLVLIDGRSVYSPLFHGVYWEVQDTLMEDIDRIEVVRGPGGTIWGPDAVDGVINIITKNAKETQGSLLSMGGGSVTQGSLNFRYGGAGGPNLSYRIYAKGSTNSPQFHFDNQQFDDWRRTQGGFRIDWDPSGRDKVTIQGDAYIGDAGESVRITTIAPPSVNVVNQNAELSGGNALVRWKRTLGSRSDLQIQTYFDRVSRLQANQAEYRDTWDFDLIHHFGLSKRQDFIWGVGARISPANLPTVVPTLVFTPQSRTDQLYTGFAQDEIQLLPDRLSFTVGAKLLHSSFTGFDTEPSARLLWTPSEHATFWGAVTRAVRTPSDLEDTLQSSALNTLSPLSFKRSVGDGLFTSETVLSFEIGYRQLFSPRVSLDVATFFNNYDHLASIEPATPFKETSQGETYAVIPSVNRNGLLGTTKGFELAPSLKPATWWRIQGSYSFLDMDLRTAPGSTDSNSVTFTEGSSPRHEFAFQSWLDLRGHVEFSQDIRFVSKLPGQQVNLVPGQLTTAMPLQTVSGYSTAGVRLAWEAVPHLELSINGRNLFQPHHAEYGGDPGPFVGIKRSIFAAITWRSGSTANRVK